MPVLRPTDGARDLRAYLTRRELSVPKFCELHGLDRIQVQRALNGERRRTSVDFAWEIEQATQGEVSWFRWRSATARPNDRPRGRASRAKRPEPAPRRAAR